MPHNILLVEDEPDYAASLQKSLEQNIYLACDLTMDG